MIWFHGGTFVFIYGPYTLTGVDHFIDAGVVFVTVQYRLNVFGFLSTEDDVIPGNFGIKDQIAAVDWVHQNIETFGGNSGKITLIGQSAGAVSVSYLALSTHLKGTYIQNFKNILKI